MKLRNVAIIGLWALFLSWLFTWYISSTIADKAKNAHLKDGPDAFLTGKTDLLKGIDAVPASH